MSFLYPIGLIALIGIPILIIIYIIKPRYQEKKITSTYIWRLSLKYKKKKRPIQWLQKSLLFFIQLLIITLLALSIARPELLLQAKSKEKVIILDASASMNTVDNGETRFEKALKKIQDLVKSVDEDDPMTLIFCNNQPEYLVNRETSTKYIEYVLKNLKCTFEEANYEEAIKLANDILEINQDAEVILYTDHNFNQEGYVTVYNLANNEWNVGISSFNVELFNGYYTFKAIIENYNKNVNVDVYLNVDNKKYEKTISLNLKDSDKEEVIFDDLNISSFVSSKLTLLINGEKVKDAFEYDNEYMHYENQNKKFKVLLVGEQTNFVHASLQATNLCSVYKPKDGIVEYEGYDIYIFDNFEPESIPTDGAVWLINCPKVPEGLDYKIVKDVNGSFNLQETASNTSIYQQLMKNTFKLNSVLVTKYQQVTSLGNYDVMITCNGDPVVFAGKYEKNNVVVFTVDLHYTELPLDINMPILFNNMVNYSAHQLIDSYEYNVGDNITLYPKLRTEKLTISGEIIYTSEDIDAVVYFHANKPGRYEIKQELSDGTIITNYFFVKMGSDETNFDYEGDVLAALEYISSSQSTIKSTDNIDVIFYVAAILLLLIVIEWGLSYYEQY